MRVAAVLAILLAGAAVVAGQDAFRLTVDVSLVSVDVGVYDRRGESVTTLTKEDFLIYEDGQQQQIRAFEPSEIGRAHV